MSSTRTLLKAKSEYVTTKKSFEALMAKVWNMRSSPDVLTLEFTIKWNANTPYRLIIIRQTYLSRAGLISNKKEVPVVIQDLLVILECDPPSPVSVPAPTLNSKSGRVLLHSLSNDHALSVQMLWVHQTYSLDRLKMRAEMSGTHISYGQSYVGQSTFVCIGQISFPRNPN